MYVVHLARAVVMAREAGELAVVALVLVAIAASEIVWAHEREVVVEGRSEPALVLWQLWHDVGNPAAAWFGLLVWL